MKTQPFIEIKYAELPLGLKMAWESSPKGRPLNQNCNKVNKADRKLEKLMQQYRLSDI